MNYYQYLYIITWIDRQNYTTQGSATSLLNTGFYITSIVVLEYFY